MTLDSCVYIKTACNGAQLGSHNFQNCQIHLLFFKFNKLKNSDSGKKKYTINFALTHYFIKLVLYAVG